MSVKAMSLVWDLECPKQYGEITFRASHKYCLLSYADHADHTGKNIFPAVPTIARKMGVDDRTVQRLTTDLERMGFLLDDGYGPRGTNKWKLPFSDGGDKLSPVAICRGDKDKDSLGDIPSGDIPSGDKLPPELKEPEPIFINGCKKSIQEIWDSVKESLKKDFSRTKENYLENTQAIAYRGEDDTIVIETPDEYSRDWLADRAASSAERVLVGIMNRSVSVEFITT